ncbi:MAG: protein kinase [Polyangiaceae bacterium]|nr:protein kinase [Polyangiaceae bacterium]
MSRRREPGVFALGDFVCTPMREPAESQIIAGKYRLESLLGHGGMGSVWRAQHLTLQMPVAVKFMAPQALADPESRQRFDREARALASLRTPHIVQVLDHGIDDDTPYFVMEMLEGEDLSTRLAERKRLPLAEVSRILSQVARALRRAHEAGIVHRDLKPSNVFLAHIDDEEVVKVLDFGVAKLLQSGAISDDQLTRTGTLLGSPGYMSPEQARGKDVDFRSDLWALAVIVFRAVTGTKPFAGDSIAELVIKLCIDPRPVPSKIAPDLPAGVDRFFEKAFAASPEQRFQSALEMAAAFAQLTGGPSLETSYAGPNPFAGVSRAWLDAPPRASAPSLPNVPPPIPTPPSGQAAALPAPRLPPRITQSSSGVVPPAAPVESVSSVSNPAPVGTAQQFNARGSLAGTAESPHTVVLSMSGAHREPTPTPASFVGFSPSASEAASAPPSAGSQVQPLPEAALRPQPTGMSTHVTDQAPRVSFVPSQPTVPSNGSPHAAKPGTPQVDLKVLGLALAGLAVLAVFFSLAIAGLRRRHATSTRPDEPEPTASVEPTVQSAAPTPTIEPTPSASVEPPVPTETPSASAAPTTATAAPTDEPVEIELPTSAPPSTAKTVAPKPTSSATGTKTIGTGSGKTAPAPTGSQKKKGKKPNFGY